VTSAAYSAREARISKAIEVLRTGEYTIVAPCAVAFDVSRRTLNNRWNGMASKSTRIPAKKRLTEEQEQSVIDYLTRNHERGMALAVKRVEEAANFILGEGFRAVGKQWVKRFLKRHPDLKRRRQRTLASERKDAFNVEELEYYFKQLEHVCDAFGIQIANIWNMDETGFRIGCGRFRIVITVEPDGSPKEPPRIADPDNREHITSTECVNAEGDAIQPMLIFRGSTLLNRYSANDLHREVLQ